MIMPPITPNFDLQPHNTLAVPAVARYGVAVQSLEELQAVLNWRKAHVKEQGPLPLLILGGGSNLVLRGNFEGLAIQVQLHGIEQSREDGDHIWLQVGAGQNWHGLVEYCMQFHCWGIENLALIPGNIGAAPIQNIGAYGVELKDIFAELSAVDIESGVEVIFECDACEFGYRDSVFKGRFKDRYIITSVTLKLDKHPCTNVTYPALANAFAEGEEVTPLAVFNKVCLVRRSKLPDPAVIPNVGSFFKNPVISAESCRVLQESYPGMPAFVIDQNQVKLAAGWLIDQAGWRGRSVDGIVVHQEQALVLTNPDGLPGKRVLMAADLIVADVKSRFGVALEMEPRVYGSA